MNRIARVAVVGTGVIGRSWMQVFARAGCSVHAYDPDPAQLRSAREWFQGDLERRFAEKRLSADEVRACASRVVTIAALPEAVSQADYVQESGPERIEVKRAIFSALDAAAPRQAILASSASALDMTDIADGLSDPGRCVTVHPVNPPHLVPVVEIVPGRATDPSIVRRTREFLAQVGQTPVVLNSYVPGFLLNRMQAVLVAEAVGLFERGIADVEAIDTVVREGLGLRWALLGPFGVAHTNADGGIRQYFDRFGDGYSGLVRDRAPVPSFTPELIERIGRSTDAMMRGVPVAESRVWRDRLIEKLRAVKVADPHP